jgi:hypothetical protein
VLLASSMSSGANTTQYPSLPATPSGNHAPQPFFATPRGKQAVQSNAYQYNPAYQPMSTTRRTPNQTNFHLHQQQTSAPGFGVPRSLEKRSVNTGMGVNGGVPMNGTSNGAGHAHGARQVLSTVQANANRFGDTRSGSEGSAGRMGKSGVARLKQHEGGAIFGAQY